MRTWQVINANCFEVEIPYADHVITDPPYGEHVHSKPWQAKALSAKGDRRTGSAHAGIGFDCLTLETRKLSAKLFASAAKRWTLVFCDIEGGEGWRDDLVDAGLDYVRTCVWDKVDSAPQFTGDRPANSAELFVLAHPKGRKRWNGGGRRNVFAHPVNGAEKGSKPHPTTKPISLMLELIELFTDPGDLILDPFCGSGTTGVACLRLGRRFIGIEKDPKYAALARERLKAEEANSTLQAARSGQIPLFAGGR